MQQRRVTEDEAENQSAGDDGLGDGRNDLKHA